MFQDVDLDYLLAPVNEVLEEEPVYEVDYLLATAVRRRSVISSELDEAMERVKRRSLRLEDASAAQTTTTTTAITTTTATTARSAGEGIISTEINSERKAAGGLERPYSRKLSNLSNAAHSNENLTELVKRRLSIASTSSHSGEHIHVNRVSLSAKKTCCISDCPKPRTQRNYCRDHFKS